VVDSSRRDITITDVASRAGLSTATVSRVLNGNDRVHPELAERVRAVINELGYQPNRLGRNLRRRVSSVWSLLISDIENPFFTGMVRGVEDVAAQAGYSVVLCNADENLDKERRYLDIALGEQVAGVIIAPASERHSRLDDLIRRGIPVVEVDRLSATAGVDAVLIDNAAAAKQATTHLLDQGFERIAFVGGPRTATTARQRFEGYRAALREAGLRPDRRFERAADFKQAGGDKAMAELLAVRPRPDAVLVANNLMAIGALERLKAERVTIPTEMAFLTFDDQPWVRLVEPPLTVVAQPVYEIGRRAGELLLQRIESPRRAAQRVVLPTEMHVRESSVRGGLG
jgi:LacI family transcriptional regulator